LGGDRNGLEFRYRGEYLTYWVSLAADDRRVLLNAARLNAFDGLDEIGAASFESSPAQSECHR